MTTELEQPGQSVLREQNRLAEAVSGYDSIMEIELARANVLEIIRVSPVTTYATWQMMLSALRSRRAQLEFRRGSACPPCVEAVRGHATSMSLIHVETPAVDISP